MGGDAPEIRQDVEHQRFEVVGETAGATLEYRRAGATLTLVSTEVDDELEGQGVGSALVREALDHAQEEGLEVVPQCQFVADWLDRHPERAAELEIVAS
jgi:uncharacterized protein